MVEFSADVLEVGLSPTVDGLNLQFIGLDGASLDNISGSPNDPPHDGVSFSQNTSGGTFQLSFSQPVISIVFEIAGVDGAFGEGGERISDFGYQLQNRGFVPAEIKLQESVRLGLNHQVIASGSSFNGYGTFSFGGTPFEDFFFTHAQEPNLKGFSITRVEARLAPVLLLDFDFEIPREYFIAESNFIPGVEFVSSRIGTTPLGIFTPEQEEAIALGVQQVFDRSGVLIAVTTEAPLVGDYHSVRFSGSLPLFDGDGDGLRTTRLLGEAFQGVDRFNNNKNDIVAVFRDGTSPVFDPIDRIVETIAHEAGHAYGLRHVNPHPGPSNEPLDYHDSVAPEFEDGVFAIVEPPVDGETPTDIFHNPLYHLLEYATGGAPHRASGWHIGQWDRPARDVAVVRLSIGVLDDPLTNVVIARTAEDELTVGGAPGPIGSIQVVAESSVAGEVLEFAVAAGERIRIMASTGDGSVSDVAFEFAAPGGKSFHLVAEEGAEFAADILRKSSPDAAAVSIGASTIETTFDYSRIRTAGGEGDETLVGTSDHDEILGKAGDDRIDGISGSDLLVGNEGADTLIGRDGDDTLDGGANPEGPSGQGDVMLGGEGNDTYRVDSGLDLADEDFVFPGFGNGGFDAIISSADFYWDTQSVGELLRVSEAVVDPAGDGVTIVGGVFDNSLVGHSGTDVIFGRGGTDLYRGRDGVDFMSLSLLGLTEENAYIGVDGVNTVIVERRASGPFSYDIVFEFQSGKDKIDVTDYGFASAAAAFATGVDDGAGNAYFVFGGGLDYLYMVGLELADMAATDFVV